MIFGQQRLLNEQQAERLERLGELLGERPMDAPVEIEPDIHSHRLRGFDPLHDVVEHLWVCPIQSSSAVAFILTALKPCFLRTSAASEISWGRSPPIQA